MPPKELEKQTRRERINPRLKAAGWKVTPFDPGMPVDAYDRSAVEEFETSNGPADYALCNDGRALGVVEAKKVTLGPQGVLVQAERYSKGVDQVPKYQGEFGARSSTPQTVKWSGSTMSGILSTAPGGSPASTRRRRWMS